VLYNALSIYDWFSLYNKKFLDAAVDILNVAVTKAYNVVLPSRYIRKHKSHNRFSGNLKFYIEKNNFLQALQIL
jgi:hypothetical protein